MSHLFQGVCRRLNCRQSKCRKRIAGKKGKGRRKRRGSETGMEMSIGLVFFACCLLVSGEAGSQEGEGEMGGNTENEEGEEASPTGNTEWSP